MVLHALPAGEGAEEMWKQCMARPGDTRCPSCNALRPEYAPTNRNGAAHRSSAGRACARQRRDTMSERWPMCVLRACVVGAVAAACAASAGAAPATEGCTPRPAGPAPQGQHWYYLLDRVTKRQCWHLGALGGATQRSVTLRVRHRAAALHETAAAAATEAHAEATEPARLAPEVTAGSAPAAQIMDASPPAEPA